VNAATRPRDLAQDLADFTATPRLLMIAAFGIVIGVVGAYLALALLELIGLFTNLFFFQRLSTALVTPEGHTLGPLVIVVPVVGGLNRRSRCSNRCRPRSRSDRADRSAPKGRSS
jgi:hypothetical protein